jgi:hypothetical protein
MIEIYRDIISHYKDNPEKREQVLQELTNDIRKAIMKDPEK